MKKKLLSVLLLVTLVVLSGCSLFENEKEPTDIEKEPTIIEIQNSITETYEIIEKGCVGIYATSANNASSGSGVIYKYDEKTSLYYVVTNNHVIEGMTDYKIYRGGSNYYDAQLVGGDATNDIAVLTFSLDLFGGDIYVHDIFNYEEEIVTVGQTTLAVGCALGLDNYNYLTTGIVSRVSKYQVMTNAELNPGNSGGGLFNLSGRLIGINTEKQTYTPTIDENGNVYEIPVEGISYAVSLDVVKKCILKIEEKQNIFTRPVLGVTISSINKNLIDESYPEYKYYLETGLAQFVLVNEITPNSAAAKAGVLAGDIIIKVDGDSIIVPDDIKNHLYLKDVGDTLSLYIYRSSIQKYITIDVIL